jgi:hypothetical protein
MSEASIMQKKPQVCIFISRIRSVRRPNPFVLGQTCPAARRSILGTVSAVESPHRRKKKSFPQSRCRARTVAPPQLSRQRPRWPHARPPSPLGPPSLLCMSATNPLSQCHPPQPPQARMRDIIRWQRDRGSPRLWPVQGCRWRTNWWSPLRAEAATVEEAKCAGFRAARPDGVEAMRRTDHHVLYLIL